MFDKVLSIPLVVKVPEFWIHQGSEYTFGFEYAKILNIPQFWIYQSYTELRICLDNSQICQNMPEYA